MDHDNTLNLDLIERFEQAWQSDVPPIIEQHLPLRTDPTHLETLQALVIFDLEFRWKRYSTSDSQSKPASLDQYLRRFSALNEHSIIRRILKEEFAIRHRYGDCPTPSEFAKPYPSYSEDIDFWHENLATLVESSDRARPSLQDISTPEIDNYRLLEKVGEGGMGSVYLAQQLRPVRRKVAMKVIRSGMDSKEVVARFEAERQALAMMDHQNIARVFDAGRTQQGQPFFVMEYVNGVPITQYCERQKSSVNERLNLFNDICAAVQHAHQKGILHRDLKPSNVLIAEKDGEPIVKVIDFGLAKAVDSTEALTDKTLQTHVGQVLGTLKYMSPEQAASQNHDVDTRADVYALGIILYELLTGETPIEESELHNQGILKILELIRDLEPVRPSVKLVTSAHSLNVSSQRSTTSRELLQLLTGDLDWIVMKALEKQRERRYESVSSLADDVRRFLNHEPVVARPPSASYRLQKFTRKNRGLVISGAVIGLILLLGIATTTGQAIRAMNAEADAIKQQGVAEEKSRESERRRIEADELRAQETLAKQQAEAARDEARISEKRAKNVLDVVINSFSAVNPLEGAKKDMRAVEVLTHAFQQTEKRMKDDPLGQASLFFALGQSFVGVDDYQEAVESGRKALEIRTALLGRKHDETVQAMQGLLNSLGSSGVYPEAAELAKEILAIRESAEPTIDLDIIAALNNLGAIQIRTGQYKAAIKSLSRATDLIEAVSNFDPAKRISISSHLAYAHQQSGDHDAALKILEPLLPESKEELGVASSITTSVMSHLGLSYQGTGRTSDAIRLHRQCYEYANEAFGPTHSLTLNAMQNLGQSLGRAGRNDEAVELLIENVEMSEKRLGATHPAVLTAKNNLASIHSQLGDSEKAAEMNAAVLEARRIKLGESHYRTLASYNNLASDYLELKRYSEAKKLLEKALPLCEESEGKNAILTRSLLYYLAQACDHIDMNRAIDARQLLVQRTEAAGENPIPSMLDLVDSYQASDRIEDAIHVAKNAISKCDAVKDMEPAECLEIVRRLAVLYMLAGQCNEAADRLREVLDKSVEIKGFPKASTRAANRDFVICQLWLRDWKAAELACNEFLAWARKNGSDQSPEYAFALVALASALAGKGRNEQATKRAKEALSNPKIEPYDKMRAEVIIANCKADRTNEVETKRAIKAATTMESMLDDQPRSYHVLFVIAVERVIEMSNEDSVKDQWRQKLANISAIWRRAD